MNLALIYTDVNLRNNGGFTPKISNKIRYRFR
jgi:hypothetical protein